MKRPHIEVLTDLAGGLGLDRHWTSTYPGHVHPGEGGDSGGQGPAELADLCSGPVLPPDHHDLVRLGEWRGDLGSDL